MKSVPFLVVALTLFSLVSEARSIRPPSTNEVAPVISAIDVVDVAKTGDILKTTRRHPYTEFLIGIPVTISTKDACTDFVGQQTVVESTGLNSITMLGASDAVNDVCIAIMPAPVKSQLTFKFNVLTGGIVAANPVQTRIIQVIPYGMFQVKLDMGNNSVTVRAIRPSHR